MIKPCSCIRPLKQPASVHLDHSSKSGGELSTYHSNPPMSDPENGIPDRPMFMPALICAGKPLAKFLCDKQWTTQLVNVEFVFNRTDFDQTPKLNSHICTFSRWLKLPSKPQNFTNTANLPTFLMVLLV